MSQNFLVNNNSGRMSFGFKSLLQNLSRRQKIAVAVILQLLFIIIVVSITNNIISKPRDRVETTDDGGILKNIPEAEIELYEQELWKVISGTEENLDRNIVNDAIVREDSYQEEQNETRDKNDIIHQASFIIDIDSIQQSYRVTLSWGNDYLSTPVIDCLPAHDSKYPQSVCQGSYRSSNDLSLYLPYIVKSPYIDQYSYAGSEIYINGDEATHTITATIAPCNNAEENKKKAKDYIDTIPGAENYKINYVIADKIDIVCKEDIENE